LRHRRDHPKKRAVSFLFWAAPKSEIKSKATGFLPRRPSHFYAICPGLICRYVYN
jgi:hypothetical protein